MIKKQTQTPGIVLFTHPLGEADRIATILSRELGKIKVVCPSVRKSTRRFLGGLDIFDCALFTLREPLGTSELYRLETISNRISWRSLRQNLSKFAVASFCVEVVAHLTHEGEHDSLPSFNALYHCLDKTDKTDDLEEILSIALYCLLVFLKISGLSPLEHHIELSETLSNWCKNILIANAPIKPQSKTLLREAMSPLITFLEETLGKELHTRTEMFLTIREYESASPSQKNPCLKSS